MRGNIVTGAVLDGWGQEEGKKSCQWKRWCTAGPTQAAFLGLKKIIQPMMLKKAQRQTRLLSTHTHHLLYNFTFFFFSNGHSFIGCVINLHQTRPSTTDAQHVFFPALMKVSFVCQCPCFLWDILECLPSHTATLWFATLLPFFVTITLMEKCQIVDLAVRS